MVTLMMATRFQEHLLQQVSYYTDARQHWQALHLRQFKEIVFFLILHHHPESYISRELQMAILPCPMMGVPMPTSMQARLLLYG